MSSSGSSTSKWEYMVFDAPGLGLPDSEERLDKLGADGWELSGVVPTEDSENPTLIFKRQTA